MDSIVQFAKKGDDDSAIALLLMVECGGCTIITATMRCPIASVRECAIRYFDFRYAPVSARVMPPSTYKYASDPPSSVTTLHGDF